jgi:hypothetical protein
MQLHSSATGLPVASKEWRDPVSRLTSSEQHEFMRQHYIQLKRIWNENFAEALSKEAHSVLLKTGGRGIDGFRFGNNEIHAELSTRATVILAPLLQYLHFSLLSFVRALTARLLVPSHAWYNFYTNDDGIGLHVDSQGSELVLLSTVFGNTGPLHVHPELRGYTQDNLDIIQKAPGWDPDSGVPVAYPRLSLLALRGDIIPHHRAGQVIHEPGAVAALHYTSLFS